MGALVLRQTRSTRSACKPAPNSIGIASTLLFPPITVYFGPYNVPPYPVATRGVRESTKPMWRRIRLVPFNVVIPETEQKLGLVDEIRAEWPGIMGWLAQGCLSWKRNRLGTPEAVTAATEEYRGEQDQFQQFVDEACQISADLFVTRGDSWREFQDWAQRVGENHSPRSE